MTEAETLARVLLACGARPGVRLFRNTVGTGWVGEVVRDVRAEGARFVTLRNPRAVTFGLGTDSPDVVGWREVLITPDMIGATVAQFQGIEVKTESGRATPGQLRFLETLCRAGAGSALVRSPADAVLHFDSKAALAREVQR